MSLIHQGYHKTLVGGIATRPQYVGQQKLIDLIQTYTHQEAQRQPAEVHLPFPISRGLVEAENQVAEHIFEHQQIIQRAVKNSLAINNP